MTPSLNPVHRAALVAAARSPDDPRFSQKNEALEDVIERIKRAQPEAFHTADTLKDRIFVHAPPPDRKTGEPLAYWYHHRVNLNPAEVAQRAARTLSQQALARHAI